MASEATLHALDGQEASRVGALLLCVDLCVVH
jgi:hypothetical protein